MTDVKHDIDALAGERWFPLETTITEDMSSIWGDWGVCSEVDKLKAVLMRRPGKEVENFDWKAARFRAPIDPEKFRAQHDALLPRFSLHDTRRLNRYPSCNGSSQRRGALCGKEIGRSWCTDYSHDLWRRDF